METYKDGYKVSQVEDILKVSHVTIHKKIKKLRRELHGLTFKDSGVTYLTQAAIDLIKADLKPMDEHREKAEKTGICNGDSKFQVKLHETLQAQVEELRDHARTREQELFRKDEIITRLIEQQSIDRDQTNKIIMRMSGDISRLSEGMDRLMIEAKAKVQEPVKTIPDDGPVNPGWLPLAWSGLLANIGLRTV